MLLEGPRSATVLDWTEFQARYKEWKNATVRFEAAVREMSAGAVNARAHAQDLARELASLHHAFVESSEPYFKASTAADD